ncbi:MAG: 23S rRNA (uracil(1939)-C(5))-methyltransferase RlmD [Synergistaceae bacterium]|jgi:23S rRNA (uracil1939-C5)-methyltransferase|nr:23S rRNA (uracil(1939)-C(5))-methyltransferase RlmD [Synergistaceae bacterium]
MFHIKWVMAMELGESIIADISSINSEGEGIARLGEEGFVVFVPGALEGERVQCRVVRTSKKYAAAMATEILAPSRDRLAPRCPVYDRCGGCQLQHATYEAQLRMKGKILSDALRRIGRLDLSEDVRVEPSQDEWGYRNKTVLPALRGRSGAKSIDCGYYERRTHNIVPFVGCPVLHPSLERVVERAIAALSEAGFSGYNEAKKTGDIRHIAVRTGEFKDARAVLTGVVTARDLGAREFGKLRGVHQRLSADDPELVGSVMNVKTSQDNFIWGPVFKRLSGRKLISQGLGGHEFQMDISAFFQINVAQAEAMFRHVTELVNKTDSLALLELYSGVGSLTAYLAGVSGHVDAVEEWRPAARQLALNMECNGIGNVEAFAESAERFVEETVANGSGKYDTIVLDPPRTGCDERVIAGIRRISPENIVYVSCNPATLARDISRITAEPMENGYSVQSIAAFDMFPQTAHVESVCHMTRSC